MKRTGYILLFLFLGIQCGFAQPGPEGQDGLTPFDSEKHRRIFRVQVADYQVLELIEFHDATHQGVLTNRVWKANRKEVQKDPIVQKIRIPPSTARGLMEEFRDKGIERLKDCDAIEDCIRGLDGTTTTFESIDASGPKTASFWELESDYYYGQKALEVPDEVLMARSFISAINQEFDLSEQFQNFLNRLPRGRYAYNHLIMKKG